MKTKWKYLRKGETIRLGDQYLWNDEFWLPVKDKDEVEKYDPRSHWEMRRKVKGRLPKRKKA
jgi:hypothetical protein